MTPTKTTAKQSAHIPAAVQETDLSRYLDDQGAVRVYQGKTRDMYPVRIDDLPSGFLIVASDRLSVFDFVLPVLVPRKGEVLRGLTQFWLTQVLKGFPHHLQSMPGKPELNAVHSLRQNLPELPFERSLVVRKAVIPPFEMIFRAHLGGSVYKKYLETSAVAGHQLPPGLPQWTKLEHPLFTPSTKAEVGHDENITVEEYLEGMDVFLPSQGRQMGQRAIEMFAKAYAAAYEYARERGICMLDTKLEGLGEIADEVFTPDSSRYTTVQDAAAAVAEGRDPIFYDKQPVRDYCLTLDTPKGKGLKKMNPKDPADCEWVEQNVRIPHELIAQTSGRYQQIFQMITGISIDDYQELEGRLAAAA